jgi:hypothetical protein
MAALAPMAALEKVAVQRDQEAEALAQQRADEFINEQRLRQNMQQFPVGDPQRNRYVLELQGSDDRINSVDTQIAKDRAEAVDARNHLAAMVQKFTLSDD